MFHFVLLIPSWKGLWGRFRREARTRRDRSTSQRKTVRKRLTSVGRIEKGRDGDRINAVLAAAGYNFGLLLRWLARLLRALFQALFTAVADAQPA